MAKKCLLLLAVALVVCAVVTAVPVQPEDYDSFARRFQEDAQKQFEDFKRQIESGSPQIPQLDVKSLKKDGNTRVYGESVNKFHVESDIDGQKTSESGGHRVINDDGKITEYDLH